MSEALIVLYYAGLVVVGATLVLVIADEIDGWRDLLGLLAVIAAWPLTVTVLAAWTAGAAYDAWRERNRP